MILSGCGFQVIVWMLEYFIVISGYSDPKVASS